MRRIENAFPAGNSAFVALREDSDALQRYLPLLQKELLRRHGLDPGDFFPEGLFNQSLLPSLRPDLAVLLQKDIFNTQLDLVLDHVKGRLDNDWVDRTVRLLRLPDLIHDWRAMIWEILGESIFHRVQSFTELASELFSFSNVRAFSVTINPMQQPKLSPALTNFLRASPADDEMRQFLLSAVEYLNSFSQGTIEIPVSIIRALNDVERIAMIEESSLPIEKQELLRFALLQIARLSGDNG